MWLDALLYDTGSDTAISIEVDAWTSVAPWTWESSGSHAPGGLAALGGVVAGGDS